MANQERTKILEMLASGTLTIDQADQLLESLGAPSHAGAEQGPDQRKEASGFPHFTGEQLAILKDYEVGTDDIRALREVGFTNLTVEQLIALKNYEVDADYVRMLHEAGFTNLTVEQLISLKTYDVDADDIRALHEAGFTDLTVEQLIAWKKHG